VFASVQNMDISLNLNVTFGLSPFLESKVMAFIEEINTKLADLDATVTAEAAQVKVAIDALKASQSTLVAQVTSLEATVADLTAQLAAAGNPVDLQPFSDRLTTLKSEIQGIFVPPSTEVAVVPEL